MPKKTMAVGAFPLIKLAALAIRQISKPLANQIKSRAKNSPFFRNYICMPPAQMYHYFEVNVKMKLLGLGKPTNVSKLNEAAAIELGAELLGEGIIFFVAVLTLFAEYYRQSRKSAAEAAAIEERWQRLEGNIKDLEYVLERHGAEIRELNRMIHSNQSKILKFWNTPNEKQNNKDSNNNEKKEEHSKKDILDASLNEFVNRVSNNNNNKIDK